MTCNITKNFFRYLDKPERMSGLENVYEHMSQKDFWQLFGEVWVNSESLYANQQVIEKLLKNYTPEIAKHYPMMDETDQEAYNKLPEVVKIYRGCWKDNKQGYSWTTKEKVARWFAQRCPVDGNPLLICGSAKKDNILAMFTGRNESEVLVNPNNVCIVKITKLHLKKKLTPMSLVYQSIQAGNFFSSEDELNKQKMLIQMYLESGNILKEDLIVQFSEQKNWYSTYGFIKQATKIDEILKYIGKFNE